MTDDYRIYVDANWPATLNDGAGVLTDFPTLQEAVSAWRSLAPEQKIRATIRVVGGPVYTVKQIDRTPFRSEATVTSRCFPLPLNLRDSF